MKKYLLKASILALLSLPYMAMAATPVWKFTLISALPIQRDTPSQFCLQISPDNFMGPLNILQRSGVIANNGMKVKFRSWQVNSENGLIFTKINAQISKIVNPNRTWYTPFFIHMQQLTPFGVADGVWSTPECKGRLVAQPLNAKNTEEQN
jgi:hypothetical protein